MHGPMNVKLDRGLKQQRDISNMDLSTKESGKTIINIFIVSPCISHIFIKFVPTNALYFD